MAKKLLFLNGLAILTIPVHHATAYGLQAMFIWTDRYMPVEVPNYDQMGSLYYYLIIILRQLDTYSVPAFLFISGYFVAFTVRGKNSKISLKTLTPRIKILLIPFIIWTIIRYIMLRRVPTGIDEILDPYHFIPLLIQFYLLSILLVPLARKNWKLLLIIFAAIHLTIQTVRYLNNVGVTFPGMDVMLTLSPRWLFYGQQPFWFPLGLVFGLYTTQFNNWIGNKRNFLIVATVTLAILGIAEYFIADYFNGEDWIGPTFAGFTRNFYILAFILLILALDQKAFPMEKRVSDIGSQSLGIYLANIPFIYIVAVLMYRFTPWVLGVQPVYLTVLLIVGLLGPLVLMTFVRRSPFRNTYRYFFG